MNVFNQPLATAVPLNANYTSPNALVRLMVTYTMAANITGTPNGSIHLEASNDPLTNELTNPTQPVPTNFATITNSTFTVTAPGTVMWNVYWTGYNYVRVVYTDASGGTSTALMNIVMNAKGI
jgi:hypothetical protein